MKYYTLGKSTSWGIGHGCKDDVRKFQKYYYGFLIDKYVLSTWVEERCSVDS
jgi:hypothetical protein